METLIREARQAAGLTQAELAARLGTTQSAISQLESARANPRIGTVERALRACGQELSVTARPDKSSIDETLVAARLRMSPGDRIKAFERSYADMRKFALAAREDNGHLG